MSCETIGGFGIADEKPVLYDADTDLPFRFNPLAENARALHLAMKEANCTVGIVPEILCDAGYLVFCAKVDVRWNCAFTRGDQDARPQIHYNGYSKDLHTAYVLKSNGVLGYIFFDIASPKSPFKEDMCMFVMKDISYDTPDRSLKERVLSNLYGSLRMGGCGPFVSHLIGHLGLNIIRHEDTIVQELTTLPFFADIHDNAQMKALVNSCLLYTSPSPRDRTRSRMPSSA